MRHVIHRIHREVLRSYPVVCLVRLSSRNLLKRKPEKERLDTHRPTVPITTFKT